MHTYKGGYAGFLKVCYAIGHWAKYTMDGVEGAVDDVVFFVNGNKVNKIVL